MRVDLRPLRKACREFLRDCEIAENSGRAGIPRCRSAREAREELVWLLIRIYNITSSCMDHLQKGVKGTWHER